MTLRSRVSHSSKPTRHPIFCLFDSSHLRGIRWFLVVVLISISLIISDVEHLCRSLLALWLSSLEKCLFRFSSHFLIGFFLVLSFMSSLYILDIKPLPHKSLANIFFHSVGCLFVLLVSFAVQKVLFWSSPSSLLLLFFGFFCIIFCYFCLPEETSLAKCY